MRAALPLGPLGPFAFAALALALPAQLPPNHAVVATRLPGNPATQLLDADLQTGAFQPLGRFPSDNLAPLGVMVDLVNADLILALDAGGSTRFVRLTLQGLSIVTERVLTTMPSIVTDMTVAGPGDVYATLGGPSGGVFRIPRNGGPAAVIATLPRTTAIGRFRSFSNHLLVMQSGTAGPPAVDPQAVEIFLSSGQTQVHPYTNFRPFGITGFVDIPTAVVRQLLAHDDGSVSESIFFGPPTRLQVTPQLPPGSTVAAHAEGLAGGPLFLGGAVHPFLKTFKFFQGPPLNWQNLVGPLPGDPVDFDLTVGGARTVNFGEACGTSVPMRTFTRSTPRVGNAFFELNLADGVPSSAAFFAIGLSDQTALGNPLPFFLPSGCTLLVSPDSAFFHTTDPSGIARQSLPVPNNPAIVDGIVFGQWFQAPGLPFAVTPAVAVHIGN